MAANFSISDIIKFMETDAKRPVSIKDIMVKLDIPKDGRDGLEKLLKSMVADAMVVSIKGGRYGLPEKMNMVAGELQCHADGFGFVLPEGGTGTDVFIPQRRMKGAMHGDKVVARVEGEKPNGRREGSIIRVLSRAHAKVIGIYKKVKGFAVVVPSNERILEDIVIPAGDGSRAKNGEMVEVEITKWPAKRQAPAGRVIEVLGDPDDADVEVAVITKKYGLPLSFPGDVTKAAKGVPSEVLEGECEGRRDLTAKNLMTIDGETAKDFDDAVCVERIANGGYRLFVAIADVSHYVKPGSIIDDEAFERSTSVYFPDRCIPMLPENLSNGICSLNPKVKRLTLTAEMEFDSSGRLVNKSFYESVIKSVERLTYTDVSAMLKEKDAELLAKYAKIAGDISLMEELALKLNALRVEDGSIDFDLPEPQIIIDIEGRPQDIVKSERNIAHRIIEEFMLSANRAVAEVFTSKQLPAIYRVHERPDEDSMNDFREFISTFGLDVKGPPTPKTFQQVLKSFEGKAEEKLITHVLLRAMKQAIYSEENSGHFGLAFDDYAHFTSPIRRYPDLIIHRLLKLVSTGMYSTEKRKEMEAYLPGAAVHTSKRERVAMEAEREIVDLKKTQFMEGREGEVFGGVISGVTSFGLFVELKDFFVEGLVHVTTLGSEYYTFVEKEHSLVGENTGRRFRLGSEVTIRVVKVDIGRRRIDLEIYNERSANDKPKPKGTSKPKVKGEPKSKTNPKGKAKGSGGDAKGKGGYKGKASSSKPKKGRRRAKR